MTYIIVICLIGLVLITGIILGYKYCEYTYRNMRYNYHILLTQFLSDYGLREDDLYQEPKKSTNLTVVRTDDDE